jgi:hypothetical protein
MALQHVTTIEHEFSGGVGASVLIRIEVEKNVISVWARFPGSDLIEMSLAELNEISDIVGSAAEFFHDPTNPAKTDSASDERDTSPVPGETKSPE